MYWFMQDLYPYIGVMRDSSHPQHPHLPKPILLGRIPAAARKELSCELEIVQLWLERLARHLQPVDVNAETVEELQAAVQNLLSA